jgi:hypothetical protein
MHGLKPSFWSRFPVNPLRVLGVIVVAVVYIVFPILIYRVKFHVRLQLSHVCKAVRIHICMRLMSCPVLSL